MEVENSRYTEEGEILEECRSREAAQIPSPSTACFDCNICLDLVVDPVVTLCGHLYCWPCVYRWLQSDRYGSRQCPVCKAPISENCLVPLYGRGLGGTEEGPCKSLDIPSRPSVHDRTSVASRVANQLPRPPYEGGYFNVYPMNQQPGFRHHHHHHQNPFHYYAGPDYRHWGPVFHSTGGCLLGGMAVAVLPWLSQNNGAALYNGGLYDFAVTGTAGRRPSRRQLQVVSFLQQLWLFLFICAVVCLMLF